MPSSAKRQSDGLRSVSRCIALVGLLLLHPVAANSTLVLAVTAREGVVVCADRRQSLDGRLFGYTTKVFPLGSRAAFAAVGTTALADRATGKVPFDVFALTRLFFSSVPESEIAARRARLPMWLAAQVPPAGGRPWDCVLLFFRLDNRGRALVETVRLAASTQGVATTRRSQDRPLSLATASLRGYGETGLVSAAFNPDDARGGPLRADPLLGPFLRPAPPPPVAGALAAARRLFDLSAARAAEFPGAVPVSPESDCLLLPRQGPVRPLP